MFDAKRIATEAQKRAEEIDRQDKIWMLYQRVTAIFMLCILCIGIFTYILLSSKSIPADDTRIDSMPIPLAAPPSDVQTCDLCNCLCCGNEN